MAQRRPPLPQAPLLVALALTALLLTLAIGTRTRVGGSDLPAEGGQLREAAEGPVVSINPLAAEATPAERDLAALLFAGLTRPGADGAPRPALARSWDASEDARVFTFHLRRGLRWHDGRRVTAADVLFTITALRALGERADPRLAEVWLGATVTQLDDQTVRVEMPQPFAPLPAFAGFGLLPAHLLSAVPAASLGAAGFFRAPVGTGPFRLVTLTGEAATLRRFAGYALGPPYLAQVRLRILPPGTDVGRLLAEGGVDGGVVAPGAPEAAEARAAAGPPQVTEHRAARSAYTVVLLNHRLPLFADARLRRALSLALDRQALAAAAGGIASDVPFAPGWWAADDRPVAGADRGAALRLLGEAGWTRGADGIARRDGRELSFTLLLPSEGGRMPVARALADAWAAIGARVTVASTDTGALLREFLAPRAFEAAMVTWDPGPDPDPFSAWHSAMAGRIDGNLSDAGDAQLDALAARARAEPLLTQRWSLYLQFAARFREAAPGIVLFAEAVTYLMRPGVAGTEVRALADPAGRFAQIERWYAVTRRR